MNWKATKLCAAALILAGLPAGAGAQTGNATPTCSDVLDIDVHGEHIVADYVTGIGHAGFEWAPDGGAIGEAVAANGGAAVRGGAGRGHMDALIAPGASFCTDSQSPGWPHE